MENKYYKKRDGSYYTKYTKEKLATIINPIDENTAIPILEDMDYPFVRMEWEHLVKKHITSRAVFARYIALMRTLGFRNLSFQDGLAIKNPISAEVTYEL